MLLFNHLYMKKRVITLSCIAAVAIATLVGTKTLQSNAYESNGLFIQNVEALAQSDAGDQGDQGGSYFVCPTCYPYYMTCNTQISRRQTCQVPLIWCEGGGEGCNPKKCPSHDAG